MRFLLGLELFQQRVDLGLILAGIQLAEEHDRQTIAIDIQPSAGVFRRSLTSGHRLLDLGVCFVRSMLDEAQADERSAPETTVVGRLQIFHPLFDDCFDFRTIRRDRQGFLGRSNCDSDYNSQC